MARSDETGQPTLDVRYFDALSHVRSATVADEVLDLTAPGIDLHYVRALFHPTTRMVGHVWSLSTVTFLGLEDASATTGYAAHGLTARFNKNGTLEAESDCTAISAHDARNAGRIVADHVVVHSVVNCDDYDSAAGDYIVRVIDASFSFSTTTGGELSITSPRVGVTLGFVDAPTSGALRLGDCVGCQALAP